HGASHAQNRAIEFTLLLSVPCLVAFLVVPELIMRALFVRGAFTASDAVASASTLVAYAIGLLPFVLIRSTVATFFARGDTATPVKAALIAAAVNIAFKFLLMGPLAQVGLALATAIGAWINLGLVAWFAWRAGHAQVDERLQRSVARLAVLGCVLAVVLWIARLAVPHLFSGWHSFADVMRLVAVMIVASFVYGGGILVFFGGRWLRTFRSGTMSS
ncbi:MAG: polysaccharide biosynthesis C-terminal domain-containing protein, partial [Pseudolabrys sp.]|nr:polysaccharide biosynthesis C-terminal domain-containing protein [Pseudolabrys sp.]